MRERIKLDRASYAADVQVGLRGTIALARERCGAKGDVLFVSTQMGFEWPEEGRWDEAPVYVWVWFNEEGE